MGYEDMCPHRLRTHLRAQGPGPFATYEDVRTETYGRGQLVWTRGPGGLPGANDCPSILDLEVMEWDEDTISVYDHG